MTPQEQEKLDTDVAEWQQLKDWMPKAKAREMELRLSIAARMFDSIKEPNGTYPEGTSRLATPGAKSVYKGKLNSKTNRDILEELLIPTLTEAALTAEESAGLIKGKPTLGLTAYKALPDAKRKIIDKMLVVKQGTIELEIDALPKG